ncbi:TetR/AcrR family transcriptional regulator [Furfurilactobacillus rossiae]|uniref:HTH tetR-type domain-containing protein n=1 Tax=Furfurilactobacillus rossiae DSM 15814 TaxID=1114972 RepID=A0A0R1RHV0_9LACO|nr:TetR/AcrR family transcriptional regulator [Furfurilactobacillus rossiae]KRL56560.1 hypothetical protein FD35_GL001654 [Furfurilactobacillus rossiae DSM 15814]QFR66536.1 TetR family transcriptional regulator [Furfurilactobacillus rossiae]QLE62001.1 hypothetical protein LROSRS0_1956 [Furfurilactobacillus rossiae]
MGKTNSLAQFKLALAALLTTRSLTQITVQDLVRKADVDRSTFYRHFLNFDDFLSWLEKDMLTEITQQVERGNNDSLDFTKFYMYAADHQTVLKAFLENQKIPDLTVRLKDIVSKRYHRLLLTQPSTIPPSIQTEFLIGGHIALITWWLKQQNPPCAQKMAIYHQQLSQPR